MEKNFIVSRQLAFMVFLSMLGSSFIYIPESATGRNSWLSTVMGAVFGLLILHLIISLQKMEPGVSILQMSKQKLGTVPGTVINVIYLSMLLLAVVLSLYDITLFMTLILPNTQELLLQASMFFAVIFFSYQGITSIGRAAELLLLPVLLLATLALIIPVSNINWFNFLPLLNDWRPIAAGSLISASWPFGQMVFMALFLPLVTDLQNSARTIYYWYLVAAILSVASTSVVIGIAGPETVTFMRFPFFQVIRGIPLPGLQRIELLFFLLWFVISGAVSNNLFAALMLGLKQSIRIKKTTTLIIPAALLIIVLCNYMFPGDIGFFFRTTAVIFLFLPLYILYPAIIFIAARWHNKKDPKSMYRLKG